MMKTENAFRREKTFSLFCPIQACFIALVIALSCSAQAAGTLEKIAQSGTITVGFRDPALPFSYLDANKRPIGYSIDICMKVIESIKREL